MSGSHRDYDKYLSNNISSYHNHRNDSNETKQSSRKHSHFDM